MKFLHSCFNSKKFGMLFKLSTCQFENEILEQYFEFVKRTVKKRFSDHAESKSFKSVCVGGS